MLLLYDKISYLVFVYKVMSLCFNSPVLQGWDLNVPKFQQGIHALIIWNIMCLQRRSVGSQTGNGVRVFVESVTPP